MIGFGPRTYRGKMGHERFHVFTISHCETDLWIGVDHDSWSAGMKERCLDAILNMREELMLWMKSHSGFGESLVPLECDITAPPAIRGMTDASSKAKVGPMAAVAGAFAQSVGELLVEEFGSREVIVENGGDIYLRVQQPVKISIFAGDSPLSETLGVTIPPSFSPLGICTSSGTVGHSLSFGKADAVMIACRDTLLADAYATSFGNKVRSCDDIEPTLNEIGACDEILSSVIIVGDRMGIRGLFDLCLF